MDKKLVAYCGLYCPTCYRNAVSESALSLRREMLGASLKDTCGKNPSLRESESFRKTMDELISLKCPKPCRRGGGVPDCNIRNCCMRKGIEGCWECADFETCKKLDFLKTFHEDAHLKNLRTLKKLGLDSFINGKRYW